MISYNNSLTKEENFAMFSALLRMTKNSCNKNMLKREINTILYNESAGFVISFVSKKYKTYYMNPQARDDMLQTCWEEIFINFYKYNGNSSITTFLRPYITAGAQRFIVYATGRTRYQNDVWCKISRVTKDFFTEYENDEFIKRIEEKTGLSKKQIKNALKINNYQKKADLNERIMSNYYYQPEEYMLLKEKLAVLYKRSL